MPELPDMFPGFSTHNISVGANTFFLRTAGEGSSLPPLLLLHGFPQTHVCWHKIAFDLAKSHSLYIMDLRGYGFSSAPRGDDAHETYSKRTMARDCIDVMAQFGHTRFSLLGHDRGARVGYRLALDHPETLTSLILLDILPTFEIWERMTATSAQAAYHWTFLSQPHPMPENLISNAAIAYMDHTLTSWTKDKSLSAFDNRALEHYRAFFKDPKHIYALCEDYRAGATCDRAHDETDLTAGRKIRCPTHVLWGTHYVGKSGQSPLEIWQPWCSNVSGAEINAGHFLAEENPGATLHEIISFLQNCD